MALRPPKRQARSSPSAIRKYARDNQVALLDPYRAVGTAEGRFKRGLTRDGVHPNAKGMKAMADYAEPRLRRLLDR